MLFLLITFSVVANILVLKNYHPCERNLKITAWMHCIFTIRCFIFCLSMQCSSLTSLPPARRSSATSSTSFPPARRSSRTYSKINNMMCHDYYVQVDYYFSLVCCSGHADPLSQFDELQMQSQQQHLCPFVFLHEDKWHLNSVLLPCNLSLCCYKPLNIVL